MLDRLLLFFYEALAFCALCVRGEVTYDRYAPLCLFTSDPAMLAQAMLREHKRRVSGRKWTPEILASEIRPEIRQWIQSRQPSDG